ncbi:MAG: hypothetical protein HY744_19290 [Deltaproteobacteria bacterium]|nr:hypothetical protein [Deltaproteobacteria bacterium]
MFSARPSSWPRGRMARAAAGGVLGVLGAGLALALAAGSCTAILGDNFEIGPPGSSSGGAHGGADAAAGGGGGGGGTGTCGNGTVEPGEECDTAGPTAKCDGDCTKAACGDGTLNPAAGEECDDGDTKDGDACSASCKVTPFLIDDIVEGDKPDDDTMFFLQPAVGLTKKGDEQVFVVAWVRLKDGTVQSSEIAMRLYHADGKPVSEQPVVLSTEPGVWGTSIASNALGRSVVAWTHMVSPTPASADGEVRYRVIEPGGAPAAGAEKAPLDPAIDGRPDVAAADTGELCLDWGQVMASQVDGGAPVKSEAVYCLNPDGEPLGNPVEHLGTCYSSSEMDAWGGHAIWPAGGGFVAAWHDAQTKKLLAQALSASGTELEKPFELTTREGALLIGKGVGSTEDTRFVAAFSVDDFHSQPEKRNRFMIRLFAKPGQPSTPEIYVSATHEDEYGGRLVGTANGRFLAIWSRGDESTVTIKARRFEADGKAGGPEFHVSEQKLAALAFFARGAANDRGDVLVVWALKDAAQAPKYDFKVQAALLPGILAKE